MSRHRVVLIAGILITASGFGWYYLKDRIAPRAKAVYAPGAFSVGAEGYTYAPDSALNVFIGSFTLPAPLADTLVVDGASNAVAAKNALVGFPSNNKMFDTNNSDAFDNGEGIIQASSATLDTSSTVLLSAPGALTTISSTNAPGMLMYVDQGATSSAYDAGEDILREVFNNTGNVTVDGSALMRLPEVTWAFFDINNDSLIGFDVNDNTYSLAGETLLRDADADSKPSAGDSLIVPQNIGLRAFASGNGVCFDGSITSNPDFELGEIVWLDVVGDCTSFTTGTDSILLGNVAPSGGSTTFSVTEGEIGYLDTNGSGTFSCVRGSTCEPLVYSGTYGLNLTTGALPPIGLAFFDSSTAATDGIATTSIAWDESSGLENVVDISSLTANSESLYVYIDANSSSTYTSGEDIFILPTTQTTQVIGNGQTIRTFDANEKLIMYPGAAQTAFNTSTGAIVLSADSTLTAGSLGGGGTDKVVSPGAVLDVMPAVIKYFDHDTSGSYVGGDDVVADTDASGYYNADDILSLQVAAAAATDVIDNTYLSTVNIYERVGSTCVGVGTDTLLGSDVSSPFLAQAITLTKAPYASSDSVASRTLCVFADIANNSVHGKIWQLVVPINGAIFSSGNSPSSDFTATTNPVQFTIFAPITMTASNAIVGATATYTFTYTLTEDAVANTKGLFDVTFPVSFNIATSGVTCTANGTPVAMTASISGQSFRGVNASGSSIVSGSVIICTMTGIKNSTSAGMTGAFTIGADAGSNTRMLYVDTDNTVTLHTSSSDTVSTPIANTVTLVAPNGGDSLTTGLVSSITWSSTGTGISYVNLYYSLDSGSTWTTIATNETNDGAYSWTVPSTVSSTAMIKIEGTDLVTVSDDDVSDAVFAISSSSGASSGSPSDSTTATSTTAEAVVTDTITVEEDVVVEPEAAITTTSVLTGGIFIKLADSPTIYAVDYSLVRHAFFDAQTFFTYQTNFDGVLTVDEDTLNLSTLGDPMPVNPGTILVKFDGSSSVYTVQRDADGVVELGPISDEATLVDAMGDYWVDNIITLEADAFAYYSVASENHTSTSLADWAASGYLTNSWHLMYPDPVNDPDGDGAATWLEAAWGTSPYDADTDNDGYIDWIEVETGHSPLLDGGR